MGRRKKVKKSSSYFIFIGILIVSFLFREGIIGNTYSTNNTEILLVSYNI